MVWLVDNHTIFRGFFNLCNDDGALVAVGFMEGGEICKGIIANNVGVQDKERCVVFSENFFRQFQRACSSEGFGFDGEGDLDVESFLVLLGQQHQNFNC